MIIHDVVQGTPEWKALRARYKTASEASAMKGASSNVKRDELLHMKATGTVREFSDWVQAKLLDKGHEIEALARPIIEKQIGEALYPVTASSEEYPALLASLDGANMAETTVWECKSWNEAKAATVKAGFIPDEDFWQVVQHLVVTRAERAIYTVTDGTEQRTESVWYSLQPGDEQTLIAGWDQFDKDLASYKPVEAVVEAVGRSPETLPALFIEVTGMVKASNLEPYKAHALAVLESINTDLQDDQDFANAEKTVKWCADVESSLAAAKAHALGQTASIDELFRAIDQISADTRAKRLELDKLVKARKQVIRDEIVMGANESFRQHVADIEATFGGKIRMPAISIDIAGSIKGKKTIASLRDAANTELARAKVEATMAGQNITINLATLREKAKGFESLFADAQQLVLKDNEDLAAVIATRIAEHKQREEERLEQERAKIRAEEQAKLQAEQDAENRRKEAEQQRLADEQRKLKAAQVAPEPEPVAEQAKAPIVEPAAAREAAQQFSRGEVTLFSVLVKAVADGSAPARLLCINQEELDADAQKGITYPGCRVVKA